MYRDNFELTIMGEMKKIRSRLLELRQRVHFKHYMSIF